MLHAILVPLAVVVGVQTAPFAPAVSGIVVDLTGAPVAGARVRTVPASAEAGTSCRSTPRGSTGFRLFLW